MNRTRLTVLLLLVAVVVAGIALDVTELLSIEAFKARQAGIDAWVDQYPWRASLGFLAIYVAVTAVNLPGATAMTEFTLSVTQ